MHILQWASIPNFRYVTIGISSETWHPIQNIQVLQNWKSKHKIIQMKIQNEFYLISTQLKFTLLNSFESKLQTQNQVQSLTSNSQKYSIKY